MIKIWLLNVLKTLYNFYLILTIFKLVMFPYKVIQIANTKQLFANTSFRFRNAI